MIYESNNYGIFNYNISYMYIWCARDQAQIKNKEKTLKYLSKAIEYGRLLYKQIDNKEIIKHTSFLSEELVDDSKQWNYPKENICVKLILNDINEQYYDFLRDDIDFKNIIKTI